MNNMNGHDGISTDVIVCNPSFAKFIETEMKISAMSVHHQTGSFFFLFNVNLAVICFPSVLNSFENHEPI